MIYALADLHLDSTEKKSMTVFGNDWENYQKRIFENWKKIVKDKDIVLIPGDISWAMKVDEAKIDLKKIDDLPGKKIMMKGNHDYRWQSLKKLEDLKLNSIKFLQNNSFIVENYLICGTRGWVNEENNEFDEHDLKI
ncbi:MAG: metallophosphoesterase, partial [Peptoniphilaceae bacterium]|nr:metallophosphoesterase [Peptoniphilaceae bacterium]